MVIVNANNKATVVVIINKNVVIGKSIKFIGLIILESKYLYSLF
jgi:hypothetical protein